LQLQTTQHITESNVLQCYCNYSKQQWKCFLSTLIRLDMLVVAAVYDDIVVSYLLATTTVTIITASDTTSPRQHNYQIPKPRSSLRELVNWLPVRR